LGLNINIGGSIQPLASTAAASVTLFVLDVEARTWIVLASFFLIVLVT